MSPSTVLVLVDSTIESYYTMKKIKFIIKNITGMGGNSSLSQGRYCLTCEFNSVDIKVPWSEGGCRGSGRDWTLWRR